MKSFLHNAWKGFRKYAKDALIVGVLVLLLAYTSIAEPSEGGITSILGKWVLVIFGYVGVVDLCYRLGWVVFVPNFILNASKIKFMHELMQEFFEKDFDYIKKNDEIRIEFTLEQLGLTMSNYQDLKKKLLDIRLGFLDDPNEAKKMLKEVLNISGVVIEQKIDPIERTYPNVRRYIDFVHLTGSVDYLKTMTSIYSTFVRNELRKLKTSFDDIHRIIIPYDGNFLLLTHVCTKFGKPYVIVREDYGRIKRAEAWDGEVHSGETLLLLTDVIVTGKQLLRSIEKITNVKENCKIVGVFGLVQRKEFMGSGKSCALDRLQRYNVRALIELDDDDLG